MIEKNFLDNTNVDSRLIGLEANLCPFLQFISSQRIAMCSSHFVQSLVLEGNEFPKISTGYETLVGQYEFNKTKREQDIQILEVIPKFIPNVGMYPIKENSSTTVVYLGMEDDKISYFDLDNYTKGSDGFGHLNKIVNKHLLTKGNYINHDIEFSSSPALHGNMYNMGVNANVAYMSLADVTEDAFVISRSKAKQMNSRAIYTVSFKIDPNQFPLNLYGDLDESKFFPDIGEEVRDDGILCGFRTPSMESYTADLTNLALTKPNHFHDTLFTAPAGSVILDVNVYMNRNKRNKISKPIFNQVFKYIEQQNRYNQRIIDVYQRYTKEGFGISPEFNSLVTRCFSYSLSEGFRHNTIEAKGKIKLLKKKEPVEFIYMDITYTHDCLLTEGNKGTGRDGCKGVYGAIREDEDMPVDDNGIRADIIIDLLSVINRMNPGQSYEQCINRVSEFVRKSVSEMNDINRAVLYVLEYIEMINPNYAELVSNTLITNNDKEKFIEQIIEKGIYLVIPPFLKTITPKLMLELVNKYNGHATPVEYNLRDVDGKLIRRVRTKDPVMIGSKYVLKLYKIPHCKSPGIGFINQFGTPVRPSALAKHGSVVSKTPLRLGEDEIRYLTMTLGPDVTSRIMGLYANSIEGTQMLIEDLLTNKHPSALNRVAIESDRLTKTNGIISIAQHIFATIGVDITNVNLDNQKRVIS